MWSSFNKLQLSQSFLRSTVVINSELGEQCGEHFETVSASRRIKSCSIQRWRRVKVGRMFLSRSLPWTVRWLQRFDVGLVWRSGFLSNNLFPRKTKWQIGSTIFKNRLLNVF
ncbi:uncharacterized protein LOC131163687 [Malania oleifera]|uniref:uncharacterized protein LOC131163687 n=1 Tax=Malania oleifera TaxID=397392 RepID=UPI0025AE80D9|nr:uncharacterized protein LOC131163687 [Malania oleifera]